MGFFKNMVHSVGQMAGQAGRHLDRAASVGFGAARRVVGTASRIGNTIDRVAKKANDFTGGALDKVTNMIPGAAAAKQVFKTGLSLVNKGQAAINSAEGAVNQTRKRIRDAAAPAMAAAGRMADKADSAVASVPQTIADARGAVENIKRQRIF